MGYYVRAFCTSEKIPSLKAVLEHVKKQGIEIFVGNEVEINKNPWSEADLHYKKGNEPIVSECNVDDGSEDCLVREECEEFIEEIGSPGLSLVKRKVISHLKKTKFIIACQLLSDIDEDGYNANGEFLRYFMDNCDGIIQADGEGFYQGNKLIIKLK